MSNKRIPFSRKKVNMRVPFERTLYAEYTDEHFKFYAPLMKRGLFVNIYAKKTDTPAVFKELMGKYQKEEGLSELDAALKARSVANDFFIACESLSKKKQFPFKIRITALDLNLIKKKTDKQQG